MKINDSSRRVYKRRRPQLSERGIASEILASWERQPFAEDYFIGSLSDQNDLLEVFIRDIDPFDCLLIAHVHPTENQLSDVNHLHG
jgi:hypothetical protein